MTLTGTRLLRHWMAAQALVYRRSRGRLLNVGDHSILLATIGEERVVRASYPTSS